MTKVVKLSVTTIASALVVLSFAFFATQSWAKGMPLKTLEKGEDIYKARCAVCHGVTGDGKGPAAAGMPLPPRDWTSDKEMKGINQARLYKVVTEGIPGTPMGGFEKTLNTDEIFQVITFIKQLARVEGAHSEIGEHVYTDYCAACHGVNGDGKTPAAAGMTPPPRNWTSAKAMKGINEARMYKSVTEGIPGTPMGGYEKTLTPDEIFEVIAYIQRFGGYKK